MSTLTVSQNNSQSSSKMTLKSQKLLASVLSLVLVAGMISPAFALTIDSFDSGFTDIGADNTGTQMATDSDAGLPAGETIGQVRDVKITWVGGETLDVMANVNPPTGVMAFSSDSGAIGLFTLTYNAGGAGLGGIDLTQGGSADRILVEYKNADLTSGTTVRVTDSGTNISSLEINLGLTGPRVLEYPFGSFVGTADLTDIDKIEVIVEGVASGDYDIELIGIPQRQVGGTVGSMDSVTLLVAGAQGNMGMWGLALFGVVAAGAAITYKVKSNKTEQ